MITIARNGLGFGRFFYLPRSFRKGAEALFNLLFCIAVSVLFAIFEGF